MGSRGALQRTTASFLCVSPAVSTPGQGQEAPLRDPPPKADWSGVSKCFFTQHLHYPVPMEMSFIANQVFSLLSTGYWCTPPISNYAEFDIC